MATVTRGGAVVSLLALIGVALGCAVPPPELAGGPFPEIGIADARRDEALGTRVRWGGTIVRVEPRRDETCFEIVRRPLGAQARPHATDDTDGRFLACAPGFYDPAIYAENREVTVIGTLRRPIVRNIGDYEYVYPRLEAESVYLWPEREPYPVYRDPYYDPFWSPFWFGGGVVLGGRGHRRHHHDGHRRHHDD